MANGGRQAAPAFRAVSPGDVVAGKYRVESVIGEGGMGAVYSAHHQLLDVAVALKVLSTDQTHKGASVDRFLREARAVARLRSEHVVRVMDVGTIETGQPYIVMELLEGEDLEHRLRLVKHLPVAHAVDILLQALEAMAHAHAAGIIHRDLKPANLFLAITPDGREVVKVLDFGIAKLSPVVRHDGARSGALTGEHAMLGSPSYMSPEQVRDSSVIDHRADIWALGVILYEIVTGLEPFPGKSVGEIFGAILHAEPVPLLDYRPDAPAEFAAVVARCLARVAEERYADVAEMARELSPFGSGAWAGHVARIEQTLARARSTLDAGSPSSASLLSGRTPAPSSAGSSSMPQVAFSRTDRAPSGQEALLAAAPVTPPPGRKSAAVTRRSHAKLALAGLLFGAAIVAAALVGSPKLRAFGRSLGGARATAAREAPVEPVALTSGTAAPPHATSPAATAAPPVAAFPSAIPASSSQARAVAGTPPSPAPAARPPAAADESRHPAKPSRAPSRPPTGATPSKLPGVLDSPD